MSLYDQFNAKLEAVMNTPELKKRIIYTLLMFLV